MLSIFQILLWYNQPSNFLFRIISIFSSVWSLPVLIPDFHISAQHFLICAKCCPLRFLFMVCQGYFLIAFIPFQSVFLHSLYYFIICIYNLFNHSYASWHIICFIVPQKYFILFHSYVAFIYFSKNLLHPSVFMCIIILKVNYLCYFFFLF